MSFLRSFKTAAVLFARLQRIDNVVPEPKILGIRPSNGLALWVLHHKTFDLGAFTLSAESILLVSDQANGSTGFQESLLAHDGKKVRSPPRHE